MKKLLLFLVVMLITTMSAWTQITVGLPGGSDNYTTIQAAIDASSNGNVINVYPGTYDQDEANLRDPLNGGVGTSDFNIFVDKSVTIQGVDASGNPITSYAGVAAFVSAKRNTPAGNQSTIYIQADGVTITGLDITAFNRDPTDVFKTISVIGNNATIKYCKLHNLDQTSNIYVYDPNFNAGSNTSHVQSYRFEGNYLDAGGINASGIRFSSGAGWSGSVANRVITGNTFYQGGYGIEFVGPQADPWDVYPVGDATVTSNTFTGQDRGSLVAWGTFGGNDGYGPIDWNAIFSGNTFDKATLTKTSVGDVRFYNTMSTDEEGDHYFYNIRGIYSAIQRYPINRVAQSGDFINVKAGTYAENLIIDKSLSLIGNNAGVPGSGIRNSESLISSTGGTAITINADDVTVEGFEITNPSGNYAISATGRSSLDFIYNKIHHVGTTATSGNVHSIAIVMSSSLDIFDVNISYNGFDYINNTSNSASGAAIGVGWSNATKNISTLDIKYNKISNVFSNPASKGAYGIIINVGVSASGQALNAEITNNEVFNLEGLWAHGIGLEGKTPSALVQDNYIHNVVDHKSPADPDAVAIMVEDNPSANTLTIFHNKFENVWLGVRNQMTVAVNAENNYWGTLVPSQIAGKVYNPNGGTVDYEPWCNADFSVCTFVTNETLVFNETTETYYSSLQDALNAAVNGDVINVTDDVVIAGAIYSGTGSVTVNNTSGGTITIYGASPALTVNTIGSVTYNDFNFLTTTDDPTIKIINGTLILKGCTITESTGYNQTGVLIEGSGVLDAGNFTEHGTNTFVISGSGKAVTNNSSVTANAVGCYWGTLVGTEIAAQLTGTGTTVYDPWCNADFTVCNYSNSTGPVTYAGKVVKNPYGPGVIVPITVTNFNNIDAVSLKIGYNTSELTFDGSSNRNSTFSWSPLPTANEGYVTISGILTNFVTYPNGVSLSDNTVLLNLLFTSKVAGTNLLTWNDADGISCEYQNFLLQVPYWDDPTPTYYKNGFITDMSVTFTRDYVLNTITAVPAGGEGGYTFSWTGPDGFTAVNTNTITPVLYAYGDYVVTITDGAGGMITGSYYYGPVHNIDTDIDYATISAAITAGTTIDGHTLWVDPDPVPFDEQVLVSKELTIIGVGASKPVVKFTGTVTGKPTLFDISRNNVTIENLAMQVDMVKLYSAIIASSIDLDKITIKSNNISATGSSSAGNLSPYGSQNAVSINYADYRVASGGVNNIIFQNNIVTGILDDGFGKARFFRSGISVDEGSGSFTGNTLQTINHDILVRFTGNGAVTVTGNTFNGGGAEFSDFNAGTGNLFISYNDFDGTFANVAAAGTAVLRLKNNYNARTTTVSSNTFVNHEWAVSMENYNAVTLDDNTFTPLLTSTTYHHVAVNTKSISTNSNTIVQVPISAILINNIFNPATNPGGTALAFYNHDSDNDSYGTFTIGTTGNENEFNAGIANFIYLDNQTGPSSGATFPAYNSLINSNPPAITTMACWFTDLNIQNDKYDVGAGLQLPLAMDFAARTVLETNLFHKPDNSCLGQLIYLYPVHNITLGTYYLTIQSAIDAASAGNEIECAEFFYNEKVAIDLNNLWLHGISGFENNCIIDGTGLGNGSGISINNGVTGVKIEYFTIQNHNGTSPNAFAGIYAPGGNNNLTVQHCTIKNNVGGSGIYANGPIDVVVLNDLDISGHSNAFGAARGIVIWNGLKSNITITNCEVYNNNCCGIELQDGSATGILMENNNIHDNGDNGFGLTGLQGPGENLIKGNTVSNCGRFGIEIKNPNGSGLATGAGRIVIENNTVRRTNSIGSEVRDIVGIAAFRRGWTSSNVNIPTGVVIQNNTVSGYAQPSNSDGFGIVVEGTNHIVSGNTVSTCDVGIQRQAGHTPYVPYQGTTTSTDGDQANLADEYFGRGNSPEVCAVTVTGNIVTSSGVADYRDVIPAGTTVQTGYLKNTTSGQTFCYFNTGITDAQTLPGNTIVATAGTYNENVNISHGIILQGANYGIPCTGSRGAESIINGGIGTAVTIASTGVTIDGFTVLGAIGFADAGFAGLNISNNIVSAAGAGMNIIGLTLTGGAGLTLSNNCITLADQMALTSPTAGIVLMGISGTPATISNNNISDGFYGYVLFGFATSAKTNITGGTFTGLMQGVAALNAYPPSAPVFAPSQFDLTGLTMSGFTGNHTTLTDINFHAGVYVYTGGSTANTGISATINNVSVTGTGNITNDCSGMSFADFSILGSAGQNITVNTSTLTSNLNRGINVRGTNALVAVNTSTLNYNGGDPYGLGGNEGFGIICREGAVVNVDNCFITNPATVTIPYNVTALFVDKGTATSATINAHSNNLSQNGLLTSWLANGGNGTIDATCNWWGSDNTGDVLAKISGTVDATPFLTSGDETIPGLTQTGFQPAASCTDGPVKLFADIAETDLVATYTTIQKGIDGALNNYVVRADAGTYTEHLYVNKPLNLRGPNYGICGSATRFPEAIVMPSDNDPDYVKSLVSVEVNNVVIDGFKFEGDNPAILLGTNVGGVDVNVCTAIANAPDVVVGPFAQINHLSIRNNILQDFVWPGVYLECIYGTDQSYNYITCNKFDNMWEGIQNYATQTSITDNEFLNLDRAVSYHQVTTAGGGFLPEISDNTIDIDWRSDWDENSAIWINGRLDPAPPLVLDHNVITCIDVPETKNFRGIQVLNVQDTRQLTMTNNTVNGNGMCNIGLKILNSASPNISFTGGHLLSMKDIGVLAENYYTNVDNPSWNGPGAVNLTLGSTVVTMATAGTGTGVMVSAVDGYTQAATVNVTNNCSISGGAIGILANGLGATANVTNNTGTISNNLVGIKIDNQANLGPCTGNTITNNSQAGILIESDAGSISPIENNTISGNGTGFDALHGRGLQNGKSITVDASPNWWGYATGPFHATNPCGQGNAVTDYVDFSPWFYQAGMTTLNGLPAIPIDPMPNISTITATPVIVTMTEHYPNGLAGYDNAILSDGRIFSNIDFPATAKIVKLTYDGSGNILPGGNPFSLDGYGTTPLYISAVLGTDPISLNLNTVAANHTWELTIDGVNSASAYTITIQNVSYIDVLTPCYNINGSASFNLSFTDATFAVNPVSYTACYPAALAFNAVITYPLIENVNTAVKTDCYITSTGYTLLAGTKIKWGYDGPPATTYTLLADATGIYLSDIVAGGVPGPLQGNGGTDTWNFEISDYGTPVTSIDFTLAMQPMARLTADNYPFTDGDNITLSALNCGISGNVKYYNNVKTVMNNVKIELWQGINKIYPAPLAADIVTGTDGTYNLPNVPPGTYDVHLSSVKPVASINSTDAAQVNYWQSSPYLIEKVRFFAGDVAGEQDPEPPCDFLVNNYLNSADAQLIQGKFVAGEAFDRENWSFWKANESISSHPAYPLGYIYPQVTVTTDNPTQPNFNFYGMATGDFNRSFVPGSAKTGTENLSLIYNQTTLVNASTVMELPVYTVEPLTLGAASIIFNYPDDLVEITGVSMTSGGVLDWAIKGNELRIGWNTQNPVYLQSGDELLRLSIRTRAEFTQGKEIRFTLANSDLNELADNFFEVIPNAKLAIDVAGSSTFGIGEQPEIENISLANRPNPFKDYTVINYALPFDGKVVLDVYSILGNKVTTLVSASQTEGNYTIEFHTDALEPGVYIATLKLQGSEQSLVRSIKIIRNR